LVRTLIKEVTEVWNGWDELLERDLKSHFPGRSRATR
jgi:hypothetical protein